jgi:hypothetical protein
MTNNNSKGKNVGEWSELYVLGYFLVNGGAYGADDEQNKISSLFYKIAKIIYNDKKNKSKIIYKKLDKKIKLTYESGKDFYIEVKEVDGLLKNMIKELSIYQKGRAFNLESGNNIKKILKRDSISAPSTVKKDLDLVLIDIKTQTETPELGFSIKSQLGGASTLINATGATNFIYEILDKDNKIPSIEPKLKNDSIRDSIKALLESGYNLEFRKPNSKVFEENMSLIDSNLSKNIAKIVLSYYAKEGVKLKDLLEINFQASDKQALHKIKEFIYSMSSGMRASKKWDGRQTSLGGLILVKNDGDVLLYYLYNMDGFEEFLINNTKLETGMRSRHKFGKIYKEDGKFFIKLNLQIRFIK